MISRKGCLGSFSGFFDSNESINSSSSVLNTKTIMIVQDGRCDGQARQLHGSMLLAIGSSILKIG